MGVQSHKSQAKSFLKVGFKSGPYCVPSFEIQVDIFMSHEGI